MLGVRRKRCQIIGWLPSKRRHCTATVSLQWCSVYAGHPLLCPLLTTVLAKSQSQDRVSIPSREQTATMSLHQSSYVDFDIEGLDLNRLRHGMRQELLRPRSPLEHVMKSHRS